LGKVGLNQNAIQEKPKPKILQFSILFKERDQSLNRAQKQEKISYQTINHSMI
jgi:hypothetical protein